MIEEIGTVVKLREDVALIRTERSSACEGCGSVAFCQLSEAGDTRTVEAENPSHAEVGQKVRLAIPTASFLKGTFFLYIFPLIGLFAGMAAGFLIGSLYQGDQDLFAAGGSMVGLILFFIFQRLINKRFERDKRYKPRIVEIIVS